MISILCPSRGRKEGADAMFTSAHEKASRSNAFQLLLRCDEDDPTNYEDYINCGIIRGPRIIMSQLWNELLPFAIGDIIMLGSDDVLFRTPGWDERVEKCFAEVEDKILMVHGSDFGGHFSRFGTHPIVHRRWVDALGYFTPPYFSADFADTWINDIANDLGRRRFIPVIFEHMHYLFGKAEIDENTRERLARHERDNPHALYEQLQPERDAAVATLRKLMYSTPDTSEWLLSDDPPAGSVGQCPRCKKWSTVRVDNAMQCNCCGARFAS